MNDNDTTWQNDHRGVPVEVCENVIDILYSGLLKIRVEDACALRHCALVCRAWRIRSQRRLFNDVLLDGTAALQQFATVLRNGPHLCDYVYQVTLSGRTLQTTANPLSLFPIILQGKLQNLKTLTAKAHPTVVLGTVYTHPILTIRTTLIRRALRLL